MNMFLSETLRNIGDEDEVRFVLVKHPQLDVYSETRVHRYTYRHTRTHSPDSEQTSLWSFFLMLRA
jgi:hypothetical protein